MHLDAAKGGIESIDEQTDAFGRGMLFCLHDFQLGKQI
jgi:hypothetical protein